jgi:phosphoribosyl-dephospho-CoA transferase
MADLPLRLPRHQLVWIEPAAWREALRGREELADLLLVADWADKRWPLILRSAGCQDIGAGIPLGLPLPPLHGKLRLSFEFSSDAVARTSPPPLLADAMSAAPATWRESIMEVVLGDPDTRCFGSLAWQCLTGLPYLSKTSDLDLLWDVASPGEASALATRIAHIALRAPMQIDGELLTPKGLAVQWREWLSDAPELMTKSIDGAALIARGQVFA